MTFAKMVHQALSLSVTGTGQVQPVNKGRDRFAQQMQVCCDTQAGCICSHFIQAIFGPQVDKEGEYAEDDEEEELERESSQQQVLAGVGRRDTIC